MENMVAGSMINSEFWKGKKVFLTGHTGFKGSWLSIWLKSLGAVVKGYASKPTTTPNLFTIAGVEGLVPLLRAAMSGGGKRSRRDRVCADCR